MPADVSAKLTAALETGNKTTIRETVLTCTSDHKCSGNAPQFALLFAKTVHRLDGASESKNFSALNGALNAFMRGTVEQMPYSHLDGKIVQVLMRDAYRYSQKQFTCLDLPVRTTNTALATRLAFLILHALYDCTFLHVMCHCLIPSRVIELLKPTPKELIFPLTMLQTFNGMTPIHAMILFVQSKRDGSQNYVSTLCENIMSLLDPSKRLLVMMIQDHGGQTILHRLAALPGSIHLARLLSHTADEHRTLECVVPLLKLKDNDGQMLFHHYAKHERISLSVLPYVICSWWISAYLHLEKDKYKQTPLHIAAAKGDKGIIAVMGHLGIAESNALMKEKNCWGYTPLHWAIRHLCDPYLVQQMIGKIPPSERLKIFKLGLKLSSSRENCRVKDDNLLHTICRSKKYLVYLEVISRSISNQELMELMRSINSRGETPLHIAALSEYCFKAVLCMAMELGIPPSKVCDQLLLRQDGNREYVLHKAARLNPVNFRLVIDLLPANTSVLSSILAITNSLSQTVLHLAVLHSSNETANHLHHILQRTSSVSSELTSRVLMMKDSINGRTVLHLGVKESNIPMVTSVLRCLRHTPVRLEELLNVKDNDKMTSTHLAIHLNQLNMLEHMLHFLPETVSCKDVLKPLRDKLQSYTKEEGAKLNLVIQFIPSLLDNFGLGMYEISLSPRGAEKQLLILSFLKKAYMYLSFLVPLHQLLVI